MPAVACQQQARRSGIRRTCHEVRHIVRRNAVVVTLCERLIACRHAGARRIEDDNRMMTNTSRPGKKSTLTQHAEKAARRQAGAWQGTYGGWFSPLVITPVRSRTEGIPDEMSALLSGWWREGVFCGSGVNGGMRSPRRTRERSSWCEVREITAVVTLFAEPSAACVIAAALRLIYQYARPLTPHFTPFRLLLRHFHQRPADRCCRVRRSTCAARDKKSCPPSPHEETHAHIAHRRPRHTPPTRH